MPRDSVFSPSVFFSETPSPEFSTIFEGLEYPWEALARKEQVIERFFENLLSTIYSYFYCVELEPEGGLSVVRTKRLESPLIDKKQRIYVGEGCLIETGSTIKPRTVILPDCEIRQGSYLRGNVLVDRGSIIGHTTEVKNSILMRRVEAGHFVYIGDSVVGSYVTLGAGSKLSNLEFRTLEAKKNCAFSNIRLNLGGEKVEQNLTKLGAVIADGCELGCNSVTAPGVLLGKNSWIYPCSFVPKGNYPPNSKIGVTMTRS